MDNFTRLEIADAFSIEVPESATHYFANDDTLFCLRLATRPATEILIAQLSITPDTDRKAFLQTRVEQFCQIATNKIPHAHYSVEDRPDGEGLSVQGVIVWHEEQEHVWIVRGYCKEHSEDYYLIHWNGMTSDADLVGTIIESFKPLDL